MIVCECLLSEKMYGRSNNKIMESGGEAASNVSSANSPVEIGPRASLDVSKLFARRGKILKN